MILTAKYKFDEITVKEMLSHAMGLFRTVEVDFDKKEIRLIYMGVTDFRYA